jgi:histone H3/H4
LAKSRGFSLYDIEQFLRDAGAERVNEGAIVSLERELEDMVGEIINEAQVYANYAGRKKLITASDVRLTSSNGRSRLVRRRAVLGRRKPRRAPAKQLSSDLTG